MACMKAAFYNEADVIANRERMNKRKGKGRTQQVEYQCPDCTEPGLPVWHLRTERPIEAREAQVIQLRRGPRRHRPAHRPELDEDYEGQWVA